MRRIRRGGRQPPPFRPAGGIVFRWRGGRRCDDTAVYSGLLARSRLSYGAGIAAAAPGSPLLPGRDRLGCGGSAAAAPWSPQSSRTLAMVARWRGERCDVSRKAMFVKIKPGPHRTRQRCSGAVCDGPSASRPVPSYQNWLQRRWRRPRRCNRPRRARTVTNRAGAALTGALGNGRKRHTSLNARTRTWGLWTSGSAQQLGCWHVDQGNSRPNYRRRLADKTGHLLGPYRVRVNCREDNNGDSQQLTPSPSMAGTQV